MYSVHFHMHTYVSLSVICLGFKIEIQLLVRMCNTIRKRKWTICYIVSYAPHGHRSNCKTRSRNLEVLFPEKDNVGKCMRIISKDK